AYWEIPDMKFIGVNQGPQAAARFTLNNKIFVTSVRYGVIRPCGPNAGVNPLASCGPVMVGAALGPNRTIRLTWPVDATGYVVQSAGTLTDPVWQPVTATPTV